MYKMKAKKFYPVYHTLDYKLFKEHELVINSEICFVIQQKMQLSGKDKSYDEVYN